MSGHLTVRASVRGASDNRAHLPAGLRLFRSPQLWAWALTIAGLVLLSLATPVRAQDIRYQPVNPSFGGNPLNSSHLQGVASAQNKFKDPDQLAAQDPAQQFLKSLQSRIYSAVASKVTDALFGKNPVDTGQVVFGTQTVDFFRDVNGITLTVTDTTTGAVTNIAVPSFPTIN